MSRLYHYPLKIPFCGVHTVTIEDSDGREVMRIARNGEPLENILAFAEKVRKEYECAFAGMMGSTRSVGSDL